ncbi:AtpZ/AtpI family protein [Neolewinella antarctica]|uniref:ATP synthase protein I n=1 Tax=Neolewinella antarctica TaxID=442734 RepID=A0ABX0XCH0_9BACT|nr:AtpZ/AtpI family protein [Neolewinella antarctica]NJC26955.1 ATP synthase protein I [Neolewinella antarctica]
MNSKNQETLREISDKASRKLYARRGGQRSVWAGLGMFGLVGWSVVVPALAGAGLGVWLDRHYPQSFSWTLTLLILGLFTGCVLAWQWLEEEHKDINRDQDE